MRRWIAGILLLAMVGLWGCGLEHDTEKRLETLKFTVMDSKQLPEEFVTILQQQKKKPFQLTFQEGEDFYLAVGYGKQNTGGYSIAVNDLYRTEGAIHFQTELIGPSVSDLNTEMESYPYLVIRMEVLDLPVVFE